MKSFLIIGMGSFGHHLCRSLAKNECEIMVVDTDSAAVEDVQAKFLKRNGADEVIYPEKNVAEQIAIEACSDNIFDCIPFVEDYYIAEIQPVQRWLGRTVVDVNFRVRYNLNIVAIKRGEEVFPVPGAQYVFSAEEHLMVLGHIDDIRHASQL